MCAAPESEASGLGAALGGRKLRAPIPKVDDSSSDESDVSDKSDDSDVEGASVSGHTYLVILRFP